MNWKNANKPLIEFVGAASHIVLVGPLADPTLIPADGLCIFVDGGAKHSRGRAGLRVGDGDSFDETLDIRLPQDKDVSDLGFVLRSLPATVTDLCAVGFIGGRKDHEWINLGEFHHFLVTRQQTQVSLDREGRFFSAGQFEIDIRGVFSLLCFERAQLRLTGSCQFPLSKFTLINQLSSQGLSNIGFGPIRLETNGPVLSWVYLSKRSGGVSS